ncbi:conserved Plasmodium protein, unknown function [Plasmodium gallinaceum]|uniref:PHD-type domain-containing protein n=1 Tax=Plasmodium gallinaceum TaxID=5849 RepID=A0A1J1GX91_PLAGA|nr:conserved Plasmodium protein, unknown function [Plasmodium gallinaceum]CRG97187.1 conserved Plasmodium protein, unknown function [Plasmodium gallinaceum]
MSDPVQVFMENVCHLTGYLHRLLFLMKELDKKEHNINKMIEKKEEIYLEKLNDIHKNKSEKHLKYNNDDSYIESNSESNNKYSVKNNIIEDMLEKKGNNEHIEYENIKEKKDEENIFNSMKNNDNFIEKKEKLKIECENININDNSQNSFSVLLKENKQKENIDVHSSDYNNNSESIKNKILDKEQRNDGSNNNKKIKIKLDTKNEYNNEDKNEENKYDTSYNGENEKRENSSDIINKDNYENKKKREKRQNVLNENNSEDKLIKKIKILDDTANNEFNNEKKESDEKTRSSQNKDCELSCKKLEKTNNINSNDDHQIENESDSNNYNEEELNNYLNEIMNDREQCMALLREKICINNQISYMIKHDYEKLKKQYDKLYTEMEMSGESPPYLYNTHRNKNIPSELEDYNIKNKYNYSNYHYDVYNIDKQKIEENENFLTKSLNRKNLNKYSEYNIYPDKIKKSKKIKKNKIENGTSSKSLKNLIDKNNNQKMRISLFSAKNNCENKIISSELNDISNETMNRGKNYVNQISIDSSLNLNTESNLNKKSDEKYLNDYSKGKNTISFDSLSNCEKKQLQNISLNYNQNKNTLHNIVKPENDTSLCDVHIENNMEEDICPICNKGESVSSEFGMVGCDSCNKWFHFECVNYENNDCNESWFCPKCISVNEPYMKVLLKKG